MPEQYTRQDSFKNIFTDENVSETINCLIFRTNRIVRHVCWFLRLYFIYRLENGLELPFIDKAFLNLIRVLIVNMKNKSEPKLEHLRELKPHMALFYREHFQSLQFFKEEVVPQTITDYEWISIVTNFENHIRQQFHNYVRRLAKAIFTIDTNDKNQIRKIGNDLRNGTFESEPVFRNEILLFSVDIQHALENFRYLNEPQSCLPLLYRINKYLESKGIKTFAWTPLRSSLIPKHITLDRTTFGILFRNEKPSPWEDIYNRANSKFAKPDYFLTSLKTNGIAVSLCLGKGFRKKGKKSIFKELYFDNLKNYEEFKDKNMVAIDPNKGNLIYCYDGKKVLRYTQSERRHVTKQKKYRNIRKSIEEKVQYEMYNVRTCESQVRNIKTDTETLS